MVIARLPALLCAALLVLGTAACENTVRGLGQDMQKTGKAIEKATGTTGSSTSGQTTTTKTQ